MDVEPLREPYERAARADALAALVVLRAYLRGEIDMATAACRLGAISEAPPV